MVTGTAGTPTGTVSIGTSGGNCEIVLLNGQGSCTLIFNASGTSTIFAGYSGDTVHFPSYTESSHTVLAGITPTFTPTAMATNIPTDTPTDTPTPTFTPTFTSTPVLGCNSIRDTVQATTNPIKLSGNTMYLDIPNTNSYPVTISSIYVAWNYDQGHVGSNSNLKLMSVKLGSSTIWQSSAGVHQPNYTISSFSNPAIVPAAGTSRLTFTFDQTYSRASGEGIQVQFSTPGCDAYPIILP
jgi:hypothetical protein